MLSSIIRTVSSTILCIAALSGLLRQPDGSLKAPDPVVEAAPPAASVPAIADILTVPKPAVVPVKAPAVVKSCSCSSACTCGCQSGQPCKCGQATPKVASAPTQAVSIGSGSNWLKSGQPWTRAALLSHLYTDRENHGRYAPGSLDSMSLDQLNAIHNSEHETQRVTYPTTIRQPSVKTIVSSGCPGGQCPTPATSVRRRLR